MKSLHIKKKIVKRNLKHLVKDTAVGLLHYITISFIFPVDVLIY